MAYVGQRLTNRITKEDITFTGITDDLVRMDFTVPAGGGVRTLHRHPRQVEEFTVVQGRCEVVNGDVTTAAGPDDLVSVPAGAPHAWTALTDVRMRVSLAPGLSAATYFEDLFAMVARGKADERGVPPLLDLAVLTRMYPDLGYPANAPIWLVRALLGALGAVGKALGRGPDPADRRFS